MIIGNLIVNKLLPTHRVQTNFGTNYSNPSPTQQHVIQAPEVHLASIPTYNFRVAEIVDDNGKIEKVALQYQVVMHFPTGSVELTEPWVTCERVKIDKTGNLV
jgi:hypothetical protein